ncbi:C-C chemokine receptor type 8-like [Labeo rohita]|uniref:C-C chemokine receptor type 8-like n=1 Tax=Labeo rohita TaxID=84645 RepID=UPI0021E249AE|nr:C-C chemokine receptor type 8-like [Labeo rohita]
MNNSTVNFITAETSTSFTTNFLMLFTNMDISMYSLNVLFGLPINSYIIWLIIKATGSGVALEFFNLNLSISEIGVCLNSLFSVFYYCTRFSHLRILTDFLLGLFITGRALFQCLMCVERYLAVVHPVTFLKYKPLRYRVICCTAGWIIIFGSCLCCMFTADVNFQIYICLYSIQLLLFFLVQLFCLVAVLRALKQTGPGERAREREEENHMKRRAFHLILITTVTMAIIYIPLIISGFSFVLMQKFMAKMFSFGLVCYVLAGFVQPVLYLHRAGKFSCFCCQLNIKLL